MARTRETATEVIEVCLTALIFTSDHFKLFFFFGNTKTLVLHFEIGFTF